MSLIRRYVLQGHTPVEVHDTLAWALQFERGHEENTVAKTEVAGLLVSTVFLGSCIPSAGGRHALLFETMVFRGEQATDYQERCATWDEAVIQHNAACARIRLLDLKHKGEPARVAFTCAACGGEFEAARSDEEALAESRALFGTWPSEDLAIVCDDCYQRMGFEK